MPYIIKEVDDGYKVCKKSNPSKCFSKKPLTMNRAKKQLKAIGISEKMKGSGKKDYIIAIPSYDRANILKEKTLDLLLKRNINPKDIFIFVANNKEKKLYENTLDRETYNKIIVGKKGISYQRNFIIDYFNEGDYIVFIDDDITNIRIKKKGKVKDLLDLNNFFINSFDKLLKENKFLWATKNMYNPFYQNLMKEETEIGLVSFSGDLMGIINRKEMKIKYTLKKGEAEQYELLFMYYKKDGGVLRFNNVIVISSKLSKGGKVSERGGIENRKKDILPNLETLAKHYPELIEKVNYIDKDAKDNDRTYRSRANLMLKGEENNTFIEGAGKPLKADLKGLDDTSVYYTRIPKTEKYEKLKQELYELLEKTNIPKIRGPRKDKEKTRGDLLGFNAWTTTFGCGNRRNLGVGQFIPNERFPELFDLLIKFGNEILPKGFKYQTITLNKDMKAKKHVDGGNAGFSVITGLGDFTGGELNVYDTSGKNPETYDLHDHNLIFNGSLLPHMTKPFKGRRYTIIYYKQKKPCSSKGKKMEGSGKCEGVEGCITMCGCAKPLDKELYEKVKEKVYSKNPKHSLFRSGQVVKEYKKAGGEYDDEEAPMMNIKKWFRQKWISLNDYYHNKDVVPCGNSNTEEKFGEYPLCRPLKIAESLKPEEMKKMIDKKNDLKTKPLITKKLLDTDKYNIKATNTGMGKDKFIRQLEEINYPVNKYLDKAKKVAEKEGYDPNKLSLANNNDNKLKYESPEGIKYFGKAGYGDYLIWTFKENKGLVKEGYARMKRNVFRKSHGEMSKMYHLGKYSPNELSIRILW